MKTTFVRDEWRTGKSHVKSPETVVINFHNFISGTSITLYSKPSSDFSTRSSFWDEIRSIANMKNWYGKIIYLNKNIGSNSYKKF